MTDSPIEYATSPGQQNGKVEQPGSGPSGVFIHRDLLEDGRFTVALELIGDFRPTELGDVLEMALAAARKQREQTIRGG